ncbi:MAG: DNA repair protein RecN, partial [Spirochaetota bacterium]
PARPPCRGRVTVLEELSIQNYALIDRLTVRFSGGMNVLSGETGAGKSILVGSLSLLHGARGDTGAIRSGTEEARIAGTFRIEGRPELEAWLEERGIEIEDGTLIVRRTVKKSGRGAIYVQSTPVTRKDLDELTSLIFDIHGQHEHQSLLSEESHRLLLDRFGGLEETAASLRERFTELSSLKKRFEHMESNERQRQREMDILEFAVSEIEEAGLRAGEEEELDSERKMLSQHERLFGALDELYDSIAENRNGALSQLRNARSAMETVSGIDERLTDTARRLEDLFFELEDVGEIIRDHRGSIQFSPDRLEQVESRISLIHRLEKKYGATVEDVLAYYEEAKAQLEGFETWEEDKEKLRAEIRGREQEVLTLAGELSERRKRAATELARRILERIQVLGMPKTRFEVRVSPRRGENGRASCGPHGIDTIAFLISPNPGEPLRALSEIASGGELSRVMLAIKSALAENDHISCMIFDEIDTGIGGEVAVAVGDHLHGLAAGKQILCITHLASIAARADNHLQVRKLEKNGRTVTEVVRVSGEGRVEEIARMLAGDRTGEASRNHAEELLRKTGAVGG